MPSISSRESEKEGIIHMAKLMKNVRDWELVVSLKMASES